MTLFLIGLVVQLVSITIPLAFIVLEGDVLPQKWVKYLPPAQRVAPGAGMAEAAIVFSR